MSLLGNEVLYIILGILLTALQTLVLRNSALLRNQVQKIQDTLTPVVAQVAANTGEIAHLGQDCGYRYEANKLLIGKALERVSDLKDDVARIDTAAAEVKIQFAMCQNCTQPGGRQERP